MGGCTLSKLPVLPLPQLETTHKELLTWIKPLLTEDEFIESKNEIDLFFQKNEIGEMLQEKLIAWQGNHKNNWLAPLWDDLYLTHRGKLQTNLNYHFIVDHESFSTCENKTQLTARFSQKLASFYHLILDGALYNDAIIPQIICDDQFSYLFKSTRLPHEQKDRYHVGKKDKRNNYVIIMHKQRFYPLYITNDTGHIINEENIMQAIDSIVTSNLQNNASPIGYMTTAKRTEAARIYHALNNDENNQTNFHIIEEALAFIHFDEESNDAITALKRMFLDGSDKYYDKALQFSITSDNKIGVSVEHTKLDATTILTLFEYITANFTKKTYSDSGMQNQQEIKALEWHVSDQLQITLDSLVSANQQDITSYSIFEKVVKTVGTDNIKEAKFSPDAFFHMALQIAAYETFGQIKSTYEAVAMRTYQQGRTECNRPSTTETLELAKYYTQENKTSSITLSLMQKAHDEHRRRLKNCVTGNGIERHLFGLEQMYELYGTDLGLTEKPHLFASTGYEALKHDVLSTTNISHPLVSHFIFGPVVEDGYGLYYSLLPNSIKINISTKNSHEQKAVLLINTFEKVVNDLLHIANE